MRMSVRTLVCAPHRRALNCGARRGAPLVVVIFFFYIFDDTINIRDHHRVTLSLLHPVNDDHDVDGVQ